jgi:hippurate hydrolase
MHACGHDGHTAMLVGAARLLAAHRDEIAGRVVFMFQPGEEGHWGAKYMLEEGLLDGADAPEAVFAIHTTPTLPNGMVATRGGPMLASADVLNVTVRGRGGHASQPHEALDPVPVACEIVTALQAMVTRTVDVFDPAVVTIASIHAGTTNNVIPESAKLVGTVRTVSERNRTQVHDRIRRLAEGIAGAHGAEADVEFVGGYPVTVNDAGFAAFASTTATNLIGEKHVLAMPAPVMGAEDFSLVLQRRPGAMVFLGTRPDAPGLPAPNHSNRMVMNEDALPVGVALHAAVALDFLNQPA